MYICMDIVHMHIFPGFPCAESAYISESGTIWSLTSGASSSVVYRKKLSMSGPAPPMLHAFEKLISPRLWIRFLYGLHRGIGPFKLPWSQWNLAHLRVALESSACRVKGVKIGCWAITHGTELVYQSTILLSFKKKWAPIFAYPLGVECSNECNVGIHKSARGL